jgi:aconitate decarboxylase
VWELIERTTARHEPGFDQRYEDGYNTRLRVRLRDGSERESFVDHPRGGIVRPLTDREVVEKFRALVARLIDAERAAAIERVVLELEQLDDARALIGLLAQPVNELSRSTETGGPT